MDGEGSGVPSGAEAPDMGPIPSDLLAKADEGASRAERLLCGLASEGALDDSSDPDVGWAIRAIEAVPRPSDEPQEEP